jgi:glycosyltransferase involved in cell wall biosynthesis
MSSMRVAVVIPAYKVKSHIMGVITAIGPEISRIYVTDDACPEQSGKFVSENCHDSRVQVIFHEENQGVGGATISGYKKALEEGFDIVVKVDGDGQMDPQLIPGLIKKIVKGDADYVKGNRFIDPESVRSMPKARLCGNLVLSFLTKLSSGYWEVFDPTNGFTAIHRTALSRLPLEKINRRYFFESDLLFRLYCVRAVIKDFPMRAHYGDESSSLRISRIIPQFLRGHANNFIKRIIYRYFLYEFSISSICLVSGLGLGSFGLLYGVKSWLHFKSLQIFASSGTVMLAALPTMIGVQLLLTFVILDVQNQEKKPLSMQ